MCIKAEIHKPWFHGFLLKLTCGYRPNLLIWMQPALNPGSGLTLRPVTRDLQWWIYSRCKTGWSVYGVSATFVYSHKHVIALRYEDDFHPNFGLRVNATRIKGSRSDDNTFMIYLRTTTHHVVHVAQRKIRQLYIFFWAPGNAGLFNLRSSCQVLGTGS